MDIRILIGMPLWYAKSVLEHGNISYCVDWTSSRSHYFHCDESQVYVIRARREDGIVHLLVNYNLEKSPSVQEALQSGEINHD